MEYDTAQPIAKCGHSWREVVFVTSAFLLLSVVLVGAITHWDPLHNTPFGSDPAFYLWALKWLPHAVASLHNPFDAPFFYPHGGNLAWTGWMPTLALIASPVTYFAGPVLALNIINTLALTGNGVLVYLIARELDCGRPYAIISGLLFYFSSYVWGQLLGHTVLSTVVFSIAFVYVTVLRVNLNTGRLLYIVLAAVFLALQFGVSVEIYATLIFFSIVVAVITGFSFGLKKTSSKVSLLVMDGACAVCASLILVSPYLVEMFSHFHSNLQDISLFVADPMNYVVPTQTNLTLGHAFAPISEKFSGNISEQDVYLGLPAILLLAFAGRNFYRMPLNRALLISLCTAVICSFGPQLTISGTQTVRLPWWWIEKLPLIKEALPSRFGLYTSLLSALLAGRILTEVPRSDTKLLAVCSLLLVLPNLNAYWPGQVPQSHFFSSGEYRSVIPKGAKVLVLPTYEDGGYEPALWQAQSNFWFTLTDAPVPANGSTWRGPYGWIYTKFSENEALHEERFLRFLKLSGTEFVLTGDHESGDLLRTFAALHFPFREYGAIKVFEISAPVLEGKIKELARSNVR